MNSSRSTGKITTLIVDDSAFMRHVLARDIGGDAEIEVVGVAKDGLEALEMIRTLDPQVATLDVEMPRMDGLTALRRIMSESPRPVVMLSSMTQEGSATTLKALELGAADFVGKPSGSLSVDIHNVRDELRAKIKNAARSVNVSALAGASPGSEVRRQVATVRKSDVRKVALAVARSGGALVIGCSTGGPRALASLVPNLPADLPLPVLIVQHMPAGFTGSLAKRLDGIADLVVREAKDRDLIQPGLALLAPGGYHMELRPDRRVALSQAPAVHGVRPSVDVTLMSVAKVFQRNVVVAILTGMGVDGTEGARYVHKYGGRVIAEHESTCVVYGMPRSIVKNGLADSIAALPRISNEIQKQIGVMIG